MKENRQREAPSEEAVFRIGRALLQKAETGEKEWAGGHPWENRLLEWSMQQPELKTRIFRFIDVYPQIVGTPALFGHIREYFPSSEDRIPLWIRKGLEVAGPTLLTRKAVEHLTHKVFDRMSRLFVAAEDAPRAVNKIKRFFQNGVLTSADLLGERTVSATEAEDYAERYADLIRAIGSSDLPPKARNISIKLSALDPRFEASDALGVLKRIRQRILPILELARTNGILVHVDMEEHAVKDLILWILSRWAEDGFLRDLRVGVVLQAYLRDAEPTLDAMEALAKRLTHPLTIRLVRGAYWDTEVMEAAEKRIPVPVWTHKNQTDLRYEKLILEILARSPRIELALGTHNVRSIAYLLAAEETHPGTESQTEFQVLYGLGDSLIEPLKSIGRQVRVYLPVGDPVRGIAYLVRRLLENSSSQSFIRQAYHESARDTQILAPPVEVRVIERGEPADHPIFETSGKEWFRDSEREKMREALDRVRGDLGVSLSSRIAGRPADSGERRVNRSPSDGSTRIAETAFATAEEVAEAARGARAHQRDWASRPMNERADCLKKTAAVIRSLREEWTALAVLEIGKPLLEADAEVMEAADFLDYYASEALRSGERALESLAHEKNDRKLLPRGVTAVISPWNFPLAIPAGMCAAALVTGNSVLFKPSELSPLCGWRLYEAFLQGGIPEKALSILFGADQTGRALVLSSDVETVAFTGSREAGREITRESYASESARGFRKLILELGGKNALIVDASADLDSLIPAALYSAFGFAGQKCSALSRLIVHRAVYDETVKRLTAAAASFAVGNPEDPWVRCGPVIDARAKARLERVSEEAQSAGRVLFKSDPAVFGDGFYVPLLIVDRLPESSRILREELFGPILTVIPFENISKAIEIANDTPFGLTGGIFSRTPSSIEKVRREFKVGNLYINRAITGAAVGRQPFGGFKESGTGSKAGGPDYLMEFALTQTVSENLSRHGFVPNGPG